MYANFVICSGGVCISDKRSVQSLDFTINRFFMKLFKTSSIVTVRDCQSFFGVDPPSIVLAKRYDRFADRCGNTSIYANCVLYHRHV